MSRIDDPRQQGEQSGGVGQTIREKGAQLRGAAQEQLENIKESAQQYYERGRETAMEWEQNFEDYVREQPVKSILIAAGVGLLVGFIWRRS